MSYELDSGKPITESSGGLGCSLLDTRLDQARHTHVVQLIFLLHDVARLFHHVPVEVMDECIT